MASAKTEGSAASLHRSCHVCGKVVESRVWYARNEEKKRRRKDPVEVRVYACPSCFFGLKEDERKDYYRERV